jgi:hypothetical protein
MACEISVGKIHDSFTTYARTQVPRPEYVDESDIHEVNMDELSQRIISQSRAIR